ncbi:unnamed protein product [Trichogramma brassicae]|uniref:Uncharacterized protein n=1 Tax=Trichogramma brassicae TaxID=86971 RepID=A0A6H5IT11_9HYME|nr:unnamed protein product [Trichogramma brassicae]
MFPYFVNVHTIKSVRRGWNSTCRNDCFVTGTIRASEDLELTAATQRNRQSAPGGLPSSAVRHTVEPSHTLIVLVVLIRSNEPRCRESRRRLRSLFPRSM